MSFSCFLSQVHDKNGLLKHKTSHRHNLTTDTASGYTNRRDWQAKAMGLADVSSQYVGSATSVTATSLTNTGATFPTTGQALAGRIVVGDTGSTMVFAVIVSNTATVLTVDQWYNPGTLAVGTTPTATTHYTILPGQMPAPFLALTSDATAPSSADTVLASELTTNGFARGLATFSHTAAATTYTLTRVFNATGTATINKEAVFGAASPTAGGVMPFESAEPNPPTLVSGDQLTQTVTVTIN